MKAAPVILAVLACCARVPVVRADSSVEAATWKAITTSKLAVNLHQVPLQEALEMLISQAGVGLALDGRITDKTLRRPITLKLRNSSVYAVFHWIFRNGELSWGVDGREIVVATHESIDAGVKNRQLEFAERIETQWREGIIPKLNGMKMSLDMVDVPLECILGLVAERAGLNVVWEVGAEKQKRRPIGLKVSEKAVLELLDKLTAPAGLTWSLEAEAVLLSSRWKATSKTSCPDISTADARNGRERRDQGTRNTAPTPKLCLVRTATTAQLPISLSGRPSPDRTAARR